MKKDEVGNIFLRHLIMAIPWGIVLLAVFFIAAAAMKQQIKEGIQYGVQTAVYETANLAFYPRVIDGVKQNVKEGIEFVAKTARSEIKHLLNDPQVKQDIKEALEYGGEKFK
ncbi:MAG: hypothetical protein JRJ69_08865 [Deltaproteobacteria bacterium]|nr:hypothetical protein [Deltaproteobacteria bacterium]MBW1737650.1 hypothetical protein [Deltaproteobacteria bacterium]MBW1908182.1 hypothetical protein [Deltaproteobacteria bacterium]MBW2032863.1 hypothetical protein [Deltaproteobacteria bacterium]MBW2114691.1 hypothetical protein [Deltaproteobacteria bacterium]